MTVRGLSNSGARLMVAHPRPIQVALLMLTLIAAGSATGIRFEFSPQSVYDGQDELIDFSERHKQLFGHEDAIVVLVIEAANDSDVLNADALTWQASVAEALGRLRGVVSVTGVATLRSPRANPATGRVDAVPLITAAPVDEVTERRVRRHVDRQELIQGILISKDRRLTNLLVEFDPGARDLDGSRRVLNGVRELLAAQPPPNSLRVSLSGIAALRVDIVDSLQADQAVMFPVSIVVFLCVVMVMFRSVKVTLTALVAVSTGVVWTFGIIAALGHTFNLLTNVVPTLTLIIGAANGVHLISRYFDELASRQGDPRTAAITTMSEMNVTCLLTFATTTIGFASLLVSRSVILREFALQASLALICEYFSVVLILGTMLPGLSGAGKRAPQLALSGRVAGALGRLVCRHPGRVLAFSLLVVAACVFKARTLPINSYMYETYEPSHPAMQTIRTLDDRLAGLAPLEIQLKASSPEELFTPETFEAVSALQEWLLLRPEVTFARSYVDLHRAAETGRPPTGELSVERIARMRRNVLRMGEIAERDRFVTHDDQTSRILLRVRDVGSHRMNRLIDRIEQQAATQFAADGPVRVQLTGDAFLHARCMDQFVRDLFYSLLTASAAIFGVISLLFRSARTGLIAAIPNLTPLAVTLGYIAVRGFALTAGNVIVFAVSLGIAVDDTIHFLSRFREEQRRGGPIEETIQRAFRGSGRAIILTTILIVSGLSVLSLSQFVPTRRFAELTGVTMLAALLGDLLLLPACLLVFRSRDASLPGVAGSRAAASDPAADVASEAQEEASGPRPGTRG